MPTRRQLKDKITTFLEDKADANPIQKAEKLAYHYEMSEQWLEAAKQLLHAAETSNQPQRVGEALYTRALTLLEHYPPEKVDCCHQIAKNSRIYLAWEISPFKRGDLAASAAAYESAARRTARRRYSV